jgi:stage V sporulation protein G
MNRKTYQKLPVMNIEVTEVKIYPFDTSGIGGNIRAVANIKLNGVILIKDIKILEANNGLFIQMPSKKTKSGDFVALVDILNKDLYLHIRRMIIDEYKRQLRRYDEKINY